MATTWMIEIDWDRTGNFTTPTNLQDVTWLVQSAKWFLGMHQPNQDVADDSSLELVLYNWNRNFSPENPASLIAGKLKPFTPVRVRSDNGTPRTHWVGWIETIQPMVNKNGQRMITIIATGPMALYKAAETKITLQENKRTNEIIWTLLQEIPSPFGVPPALQPGDVTIKMAGDNWVRRGGLSNLSQDTFDIYRAIADVTAAERGKFFFSRQGNPTFFKRSHLSTIAATSVTLTDTMTGMEYTYAGTEQCKNDIVVVCHPRTISASDDEILWELEGIIVVPEHSTRFIYLKYQDDSGNRIGGREAEVSFIDFDQGSASATLVQKASGTELKLVNNGSQDAIISGCRVKGRKITDFELMEARVEDTTSINTYGRRTMRINLPSIDDIQEAERIAEYELERRKDPRGQATSVTMMSHGKNGGGLHHWQLHLSIGNRIRVEEAQTGHGAPYFIMGEAHKLTDGATRYETTWYLEPAPPPPVWKLNHAANSLLGTTTYLG